MPVLALGGVVWLIVVLVIVLVLVAVIFGRRY